jgi:hypothetical protein
MLFDFDDTLTEDSTSALLRENGIEPRGDQGFWKKEVNYSFRPFSRRIALKMTVRNGLLAALFLFQGKGLVLHLYAIGPRRLFFRRALSLQALHVQEQFIGGEELQLLRLFPAKRSVREFSRFRERLLLGRNRQFGDSDLVSGRGQGKEGLGIGWTAWTFFSIHSLKLTI